MKVATARFGDESDKGNTTQCWDLAVIWALVIDHVDDIIRHGVDKADSGR